VGGQTSLSRPTPTRVNGRGFAATGGDWHNSNGEPDRVELPDGGLRDRNSGGKSLPFNKVCALGVLPLESVRLNGRWGLIGVGSISTLRIIALGSGCGGAGGKGKGSAVKLAKSVLTHFFNATFVTSCSSWGDPSKIMLVFGSFILFSLSGVVSDRLPSVSGVANGALSIISSNGFITFVTFSNLGLVFFCS
jgi:hypothetical protein